MASGGIHPRKLRQVPIIQCKRKDTYAEGDRGQVRGVNSEKREKDKSKVVAGVKGRKKKERTLIQCRILLQ